MGSFRRRVTVLGSTVAILVVISYLGYMLVARVRLTQNTNTAEIA